MDEITEDAPGSSRPWASAGPEIRHGLERALGLEQARGGWGDDQVMKNGLTVALHDPGQRWPVIPCPWSPNVRAQTLGERTSDQKNAVLGGTVRAGSTSGCQPESD